MTLIGAATRTFNQHGLGKDQLLTFRLALEFLELLWDEGRRAAGEFLDTNADHLSKCSTADLDVLLKEC